QEAERIARTHVHGSEDVAAPAACVQPELEGAALAAREPDGRRVSFVRGVDPVREPDVQLEPVGGGLGVELEPDDDVLALERSLGVGLEAQVKPGPFGERETDAEREQERRRHRNELRTSRDERREQPERREADVGPELRPGPARHARRGSRSSAVGVGTVSRRSRTMSSGETRCTHSSGRSISRCASAGTATAFTSSGVTKSRPSSAARQRESFSSASEPRGDAPTWIEGALRVAATTSTMYRPTGSET